MIRLYPLLFFALGMFTLLIQGCPAIAWLTGSGRASKAPMLDSSAVFLARVEEIGLNRAEIAKLKADGLDTYGKLAFACNYVPGQAQEQPLLDLCARICEVVPAPPDRIPLIRRIFFESYTLAAADLRTKLEKKDDDQPRKLAQAERSARYTAQVTRLGGLGLVGELEPSHTLVDLVFQMLDDNQMKYVRWEQCTKRDQELMGIRSDPTWKPDATGVIREVRVQAEVKADTSTDLRLKYALQRRSLALDQARLVDFSEMEKWTQILLEAYTTAPIAGHKKVSIEQIQHADMELFKKIIKETRDRIRPSGGVAPVQQALRLAINAPEIQLHLQPLPGASASKRTNSEEPEDAAAPKRAKQATSEVERLKRTIENLSGQVKNLKGSPRAKQKGKGKGGKSIPTPHGTIRMPPELIGQNATNGDGEPICFSFNLNGCRGAKAGQRCSKGWHVCAKPGCDGHHSQRDHK